MCDDSSLQKKNSQYQQFSTQESARFESHRVTAVTDGDLLTAAHAADIAPAALATDEDEVITGCSGVLVESKPLTNVLVTEKRRKRVGR